MSADVVRQMYEAIENMQMDTFVALLDPDVEWTVPGSHDLAGTFTGVPALLAHLAEVAQRTRGQIKVQVEDVLEGDGLVVAVADVDISVDGRTIHDRQLHLFELRDGHIRSVREYHGDLEAMNDLFDPGP